MAVKLTADEYKTIAIVVVIAALSLGVSVKYFWRAFPEAAIDIRVNRDESTPIAQKFLSDRYPNAIREYQSGSQPEGYRHAAIFAYDDDTKLYLERTQGLERLNQLTRGPIHLWRWAHRWFKPQQKEEFRADVTPTGEVVGFEHEIPEAAPGANLDQPAARLIAEQFLRDAMKRDLGDLEFVEAESNKRPARTDHTFTWKQKSVNLGDGSLRVEAGVDGDQIASYSEYVKVPEQWSRDYEKMRSRNNMAQVVDEVLWIALSVAMAVVLILRLVRRASLPVRLSLGFGVALAVLYLLNHMNGFSLAQFGYQTTDPYSSFVAGYVRDEVLGAIGLGVAFFLLVAASEPAYREGFPRQISLRRYFSWQGLRSRSFFMANVVGIGLTFFFFAYQTVFYLAANRLGAWAPSEPKFSDDLNTRMPWVAALYIGSLAAVSEEMQFRAFAIPFLKKLTRSWPLALALAAFNWGFLHSAYPNQPFFIRGVEVGLGGMVMGLVMLRFGIGATLVWHYSVDAVYTAFLLLRSSNHYLMVSGAITAGIMLIPLVVALVAYLRSGTFTEEAPLTNASELVSRAPAEEEEAPVASPRAATQPAPLEKTAATSEASAVYRALSTRRLALAGVLTAGFIALALAPVYQFGDGVELRSTRGDAVRAASEFLAQRNVPVGNYHRVAWLQENVDPLAVRYLLERRSVKEADQIYREATRRLLWEVRYFRPLEKEEYRVSVDATTGGVFGYGHELDENAPGASLPLEQARVLAEKALDQSGYKLSDFDLQDSHAQKRKAREDYKFVWQAKPGDPRNVGDEHYRIEVDLAGEQVVGLSRFFKLPEEWERQRTATQLPNVILTGLEWLFGAGLVGGAIFLFVIQARSRKIPWRASAKVGGFLAVLMALVELNRLSVVDIRYTTSIPLSTYRVFVALSFLIVPLVVGLLCWLLVGLATSLYPNAWGIFDATARRVWRRDAAVALVVGVAAAAGINRLEAVVSSHFHAYAPVRIDLVPSAFDTTWPGPGFFVHGLFNAVVFAAGAAVLIYLARLSLVRRAWWLWLGGLLLLVSLGPAGAHSVAEFLLGWAMGLVSLVAVVGIVYAFFRDNVLAYLAAALCLQVAEPVVALLSQPPVFFRWNGAALVALTAVVLGWLLLPTRPSQTSS